MKYKLKIIIQKHFIGGDEYSSTLTLVSDGAHDLEMPVIVQEKDFVRFSDNISGLKTRLELCGHKVEISTNVWNDPNFSSADEANECLDNH